MYDQLRQWRGIPAPSRQDRASAAAGRVASGTRDGGRQAQWHSVRRVGLRLATLSAIALLCALSGTAVFDGRADPVYGPPPVLWIAPQQGIAPFIAE